MGEIKKRESVLLVIGIIFVSLLVVASSAAFYAYNFYVFKTLRVCVTQNTQETEVVCSTKKDCVSEFKEFANVEEHLKEMPDFLRDKMDEIFDVVVYCDVTCSVREIRGLNNGGFQEIESCNSDEKEIKLEVRGKEGLELLSYAKSLDQES